MDSSGTVSGVGVNVAGITVVKLTGSENWSLWKFQTKILLNGQGLFGIVDGTVKKNDSSLKANEWEVLDAKAQIHIVSRVTENVMQHLLTCCTAAEMWSKLSCIYELKSSTSVHLLQERFMRYKYEEGGMANLFSKVEHFANQLKQLGEPVSDQMIITKVIMTLPPQYRHFVSAWESVSQESQTLNGLQARLLIEEERMKENEEPVALTVQNIKCFKCGKIGHKKNVCRSNTSCSYCKKMGHTMEQCYFKKNKEKGNSSKENKESRSKNNKGNNSHDKKGDNSKANAFISSAFVANENSQEEWILDSGASDHITPNKNNYFSFSGISGDRYVIVGDGRKLKVQGIGQILLKAFDGTDYVETSLNDVLYVPELKVNLFSVTKAINKGYMLQIKGKSCELIKNNIICCVGKCVGKFYVMQFTSATSHRANLTTQVKENNTLMDWHEKLAHQNLDYCRSILKNNNIKFIDSDDSCVACMEGKCHRLPFPRSLNKTNMCCEILHADVCGPMEVSSVGGSRYILVIKDDFSKYRKVYFLKHKSEVPERIKQFINYAEIETNSKVKILRTDNGTEFLNKTLESFLSNKGIQHQTTVVYTPEQNGKIEREMRTIIEAARTMLIKSKLDKTLWAEAVNTAVYTLNRTYVKNENTDKTPYECWSGRNFEIHGLHKFGNPVFSHVPKEKRRKLDSKGKKGYFVGYGELTKGYRIYYKEENIVEFKRDVDFIKDSDINDSNKISNTDITENIEITIERENLNSVNSSEENSDSIIQNENSRDSTINSQTEVNIETLGQNLNNSVNVDELINESNEEFYNTNTEVQSQVEQTSRFRPRNQIRPPEWHKDYSTDYTCFLSFIEENPQTYEEAMKSAEKASWQKAMEEEISSLKENNTWELVPKPVNCKVIESKWVYKRKLDDQGNIASYKARLVARGFQQTDFTDDNLFAPVAKLPTVRTLLAVCNQKGILVHQMDVKSAFLHGDIKDEIYLSLPKGYTDNNMVCKLKKSLYGLKSSPKNWNDKFNSVMLSEGFKQCKTDYGLYVKQYNGQIVYLLLYVDDLLISGTDIECVNKTKEMLKRNFSMKDLGLAKYFLGISIEQDAINGILKISQKAFLKQILQKYNMSECKSVATPMDSKFKTDSLNKQKSESQELETRCRQLIGCLLYAVLGSRPDLCACVSILSRFQKCASEELWNMLKRVLRYIKGTIDLSLVFERNKNDVIIVGYVDSDWGGDLVDRRSTAGFVFKIFGSPVSWCTRKQPSVALSSTEAEYMALSMATAEACWLKQLITDFFINVEYVLIYEDNQSSIKVAKNPVLHKRMKHIDIKHHFIREKIVEGLIKLSYVETSEQVADLLTKPLSSPTFVKLRGYLNLMIDIK